jgi:DNA-binding transcriptional MerR regulator
MCAESVQPADGPRIRIGELSRRTGVGVDTLRAWERRYGLLAPDRSDGGFRLYGPADERRALEMRSLIGQGHSAREAARTVLQAVFPDVQVASPNEAVAPPAEDLVDAIRRLDGDAANRILDESLATLSFDGVARRLILPALQALGEGWERGEVTIGQEHFASNLLRGRLLGLASGWHAGAGRTVVLACPPGEHHDLGLIVFGLALSGRGWRVVFLGANTPISTMAETADQIDAELVAIESLDPGPLRDAEAELRALAAARTVAVGGAAASTEYASALGLVALDDDPIGEAARLANGLPHNS